MSLDPGTRIGPYDVLSPLGAGGMGEVYRAHDSRLDRDVALKLLPPAIAADPHRVARFQREAQVLASLNHPHIAQIYGLEDSPAGTALVMELIDGPTLAARLEERRPGVPGDRERGPVALEEALDIGRQVAEALEAAHDKGIIHRDLKPGNVMLTSRGIVKVLDFGLAGVASAADASVDMTQSPTLTVALSPNRKMMVVPVKSGTMFEPGIAAPLFDVPILGGLVPYAVGPDGRFLLNVLTDVASARATPLIVVLNWRPAFR